MRSHRVVVAVAGFLAVFVWSVSGLFTPSRAQEDVSFGGFDMEATSAAVRWIVTPRNNFLPVESLVDLSTPYTLTELSGSPSGHALSAVPWPGATVADACNAYPKLPPDERFPKELLIDTPCWRYRAESFHPQGPPQAQFNDMPGALMTSRVGEREAIALGQYQGIDATAFRAGPSSSVSSSSVSGNKIVSDTRATVSNVLIAVAGPGGNRLEISLDSVVSTAKVTSDGAKAVPEAKTIVVGASIAGQPVVIDESGIRAGNSPVGPSLGSTTDSFNTALRAAGVTITVSKPIVTGEGPAAEVVAGGVIVTFDNSSAVDLLPTQALSQLPIYADPAGKVILVLGQAAAAANAAEGFSEFLDETPIDASLPPTEVAGDQAVGGGEFGITEDFGGTSASGSVSSPSTTRRTGGTGIAARASRTGVVPGDATTLGLVVGALIVAVAAGAGMQRLALGVFAAPPTTACPLE